MPVLPKISQNRHIDFPLPLSNPPPAYQFAKKMTFFSNFGDKSLTCHFFFEKK